MGKKRTRRVRRRRFTARAGAEEARRVIGSRGQKQQTAVDEAKQRRQRKKQSKQSMPKKQSKQSMPKKQSKQKRSHTKHTGVMGLTRDTTGLLHSEQFLPRKRPGSGRTAPKPPKK